MRPPMRERDSTIKTLSPALPRSRAATKPAAPAPMMRTSGLIEELVDIADFGEILAPMELKTLRHEPGKNGGVLGAVQIVEN